jgi:hypothetical protein
MLDVHCIKEIDLSEISGVGIFIIHTGDDYYVGRITCSDRVVVIIRKSPYLGTVEYCEDYCYSMGIISKGIISDETLRKLKDSYYI